MCYSGAPDPGPRCPPGAPGRGCWGGNGEGADHEIESNAEEDKDSAPSPHQRVLNIAIALPIAATPTCIASVLIQLMSNPYTFSLF